MPNTDSPADIYFRKKNRDRKFGRIVALIFVLPVILAFGSCVGMMVR